MPEVLISTGAMKAEPMAEPIEPTMLTSALVVATSAGVATMATIDFIPGVTTWVMALVTKMTKSKSPTSVPMVKGVTKQSTACTAKPSMSTWRFGRESASNPPCNPKRSAAR